eukprot:2729209-Karenia_brevis.AAC.1
MTEKGRRPPVKDPELEKARKTKSGVRNKNVQIRLHKLKICIRLVAWLDSYIAEVQSRAQQNKLPRHLKASA